MADTTTPPPGSDVALEQGCRCPVLDNAHGRGAFGGGATDADGTVLYWTTDDCPLHRRKEATTR